MKSPGDGALRKMVDRLLAPILTVRVWLSMKVWGAYVADTNVVVRDSPTPMKVTIKNDWETGD